MLDKAIEHGKEFRRQFRNRGVHDMSLSYKGSRAYQQNRDTRLYRKRKQEQRAKDFAEIDEEFDADFK